MSLFIQLTEVSLAGEGIIEVPALQDAADISTVQQGKQQTSRTPIVGQQNSVPVTILTLKSGRKLVVKETFDELKSIIAGAAQ